MGRSQREKGKRWERECAALLRDVFEDPKIRRGWQVRCGDDEADIVCPALWVECKHHNQVPLRAALRQAIKDCPEGKIPVVFAKDNRNKCKALRMPPMAMLRLDDFLDLLKEWWERGLK